MKTLIIEDNLDTIEWLKEILISSFSEITIDAVISVTEATALTENNYDLCLVDLNLPDGSGVTVLEEFCKKSPDTFCVVSTIYADSSHVFPAIKAGAAGYLLKDQGKEEYINQLKGVLEGKPALSPAIARSLLSFFHDSDPNASVSLTPRETEVLQFIGKGIQRKEISQLLEISHNTVAGYAKTIYKKLNINSCAEAATEAIKRGLI